MSQPARAALLKELFSPEANGIGGSYIRVSIGASDLDEEVFSYDDLHKGQIDTLMQHFGLSHDLKAVIPVLKEILAINPDIKILASPWSPPTWMKTNGDARGGSLKPEFYRAYALYFLRYIYDMKKQGKQIDTIAIVNENTEYGTSVGDAIVDEAKKANLPVAIRIPYSASSTDVSAQVLLEFLGALSARRHARLGPYCRVMATENSPLRMRAARPSA